MGQGGLGKEAAEEEEEEAENRRRRRARAVSFSDSERKLKALVGTIGDGSRLSRGSGVVSAFDSLGVVSASDVEAGARVMGVVGVSVGEAMGGGIGDAAGKA